MEELISQALVLAKGIWKYRRWAIATAWLVMLAGAAAVYAIPAQYAATARVFVDTASILKPLLAGMTSVPNVEQQVSIMSRTLVTRPNVEKVLRMVDLDLKTNTLKQHQAMVDDLMTNIKITGMAQNDLYAISYTNTDPKVVRDVVQAFLTIFVEGGFGDKKLDSAKAIVFINEQIKNYEEKLLGAESALKDFKLQNSGVLPRAGADYGSRLQEASDLLGQTRLELREAEQAHHAIERELATIPAGAMADTPAPALAAPMSEIDTRILALNKSLDALRLQYTEQHPDIIAARQLLSRLEASRPAAAPRAAATVAYSPILQQMKMALASSSARVASLRARVAEYAQRDERLRQANLKAPAVEQQLAQLNRDYLINKENYEKLVARRESAKLSGDLSATTSMMTFRVIDPPTVPLTATGPNRVRLLSLVFGAALLLGTLAAILMSRIRPTFASASALRAHTGLPVLGSVSLYWTPTQRQQLRRQRRYCGGALALMLLAYAGLIAPFIGQP
jgi:polysaccharide chain length determinant protein (PEP-CTERM system associated)